ncbi:MAG: bifunctional riboflavin kinase/FAD synthetase [Anaerovoracaceae bacterium]|nr:bifunctional riboflavin kinase/FAD synthetase [Bacillota bacterium]MDD7735084.1 bifunctional riboflavin kinase/FAD synthetase [Bacillota bacterium]MDY5906500.1 bifunctional riboflavin kinase/FAD synthetase [Anaerovoracaceae bacterium]
MVIFRNLAEIQDIEKTAVALGNFDGIHKGHQVLIKKAVKTAEEKGIKSAVFTFSNHPRNVIAGNSVVRNIIYEDEKIEILEEMGVDYLFSISFEEIMKLSPQDFVDKVLIERFRIDTAVCGFNFTYGYKAAGTADMLRGMAAGRFDVAVVDPVKVNGQVVSSTLIREKIMNGDVEAVPELLGRNFTIRGTVIHGNEIGRTIGFPTCNIVIDESMAALPNGVYMTYCYVEGVKYCSITNVGNKPTIGEYGKNIETNIFNFNENIYDKKITVEFLKKIRDEQKFDDLEALKKQIHDDSVLVRKEHGL